MDLAPETLAHLPHVGSAYERYYPNAKVVFGGAAAEKVKTAAFHAAYDASRKRRREAPDYDPSKEYTGPPLRSTKDEPNPDIAFNEGAELKRARSE